MHSVRPCSLIRTFPPPETGYVWFGCVLTPTVRLIAFQPDLPPCSGFTLRRLLFYPCRLPSNQEGAEARPGSWGRRRWNSLNSVSFPSFHLLAYLSRGGWDIGTLEIVSKRKEISWRVNK